MSVAKEATTVMPTRGVLTLLARIIVFATRNTVDQVKAVQVRI